jgi:hypothetical protein
MWDVAVQLKWVISERMPRRVLRVCEQCKSAQQSLVHLLCLHVQDSDPVWIQLHAYCAKSDRGVKALLQQQVEQAQPSQQQHEQLQPSQQLHEQL